MTAVTRPRKPRRTKYPRIEVGLRFDRLVVTWVSNDRRKCVCQCDCGEKKEFWCGNVAQGKARSCGCWKGAKRDTGFAKPLLTEVWG